MATKAALIGVDWGTSAFRAFLLAGDGAVIDRRSGSYGIMTVAGGDFAGVLEAQVGEWLSSDEAPVILSGMIGSRQGWIEAPYVECPASLKDLAEGLTHVPFALANTHLVSGVAFDSPTMRDLMRGEETQIFGALTSSGGSSGQFLLPGTHSKWVNVEDGRIVSLATYMTGEIYAACREHTILGRLMEPGKNPAAFARGVGEGARAGTPGALLNRLFGVRTSGLSGALPNTGLADYMSGLLIGAEIADARGGKGQSVSIIASDALAQRYQSAAEQLGVETTLVKPDVVAAGHLAIARAAGLVS